jgi:hypothetical protein
VEISAQMRGTRHSRNTKEQCPGFCERNPITCLGAAALFVAAALADDITLVGVADDAPAFAAAAAMVAAAL